MGHLYKRQLRRHDEGGKKRRLGGVKAGGRDCPVRGLSLIAYDPAGRLWVAYEEGGERWGKDFGVAETTGLALYEGRAIRLRGFAQDGRPIRTRTDPGDRMEGPSSNKIDNGHQNDSDAWLKPDPERIKMRKASDELPDVIAPRNTSPRMTIDASGRIWLAYRINSPLTIWQPPKSGLP